MWNGFCDHGLSKLRFYDYSLFLSRFFLQVDEQMPRNEVSNDENRRHLSKRISSSKLSAAKRKITIAAGSRLRCEIFFQILRIGRAHLSGTFAVLKVAGDWSTFDVSLHDRPNATKLKSMSPHYSKRRSVALPKVTTETLREERWPIVRCKLQSYLRIGVRQDASNILTGSSVKNTEINARTMK